MRTISSEHAVIFQDVENTTHLTEDKDARAFLIHGFQKLVQDHHFARVFNQVLIGCVGRARFLRSTVSLYPLQRKRTNRSIKQIWMTSH